MDMKMRKLFVPLLAMGMVVFTDVTFAAFGGSRSSSGVSRSYSRPATTSYSKPATTYKAPSYTSSSSSSSYSSGRSNNSGYQSNYNSGSGNNNYRSNSYNEAPRQNSAMRDIGVTAAGVAGGVLAASAITALISSPGHAGMFTHPQYPGQYFNQQGQPVTAPVQQAPQAAQQQYYQPQSQQAQQPVVVVQQQQPQESGFTFFGILWGALWFLIKLAFFLSIVGAIGYGIYKLVTLGRKKEVRDRVEGKIKEKFDLSPKGPTEFDDLDSRAMAIFYEFQKHSDDATWVEANTKYMPVDDCLSPPSKVLTYQHRTIDVVVEQGNLRGTVLYEAKLDDGTGVVRIKQHWNFEKDGGVWKLIGIEQND